MSDAMLSQHKVSLTKSLIVTLTPSIVLFLNTIVK